MLLPPHGRRVACTIAALTLGVAALSGCGTNTQDPGLAGQSTSPSRSVPTSTAPVPTASQTASESPEVTKSTSPDASEDPSEAASAGAMEDSSQRVSQEGAKSQQARSGILGDLLTADEMPGFNATFTWRTTSTRNREGHRPFATCHRFDMASIGATKVSRRTFEATQKSPGISASNLVARFADQMTARRAYEVLKSWRAQCEDRLQKFDKATVGKLQGVRVVDGAVGSWYLLTYGPTGDPDSSYFDAQGLTRAGSTISVVQMRLVGQDYNYPAGKEPMVAAVQRAARRIA